MKVRPFVAAALVAAAVSPAHAQGNAQELYPNCSVATATKYLVDACVTANDLFSYMVPQLGVAIAGGNATLGTGSVLGTRGMIPRFTIGVRANVVKGNLPDVGQQFDTSGDLPFDTTGTAVQRNYANKDQVLGAPTVDAAIGVFNGIPLGITRVGGVDLLVSASYLPEFDEEGEDVQVLTPDGSLNFGFGARVGIIKETLAVPGVSFTYLQRGLPTVDITARIDAEGSGDTPDTLTVSGLDLDARSWRLVASKSFLFFGLAAGVGQDTYESSGDLRAAVTANGTVYGGTDQVLVDFSREVTRTNMFLDLSLNLPVVKFVAEIGQVSGGDVNTFSTFEKKADDSQLYGSLGLRFGF